MDSPGVTIQHEIVSLTKTDNRIEVTRNDTAIQTVEKGRIIKLETELEVHTQIEKDTLVDEDEFLIADSENSYVNKKVSADKVVKRGVTTTGQFASNIDLSTVNIDWSLGLNKLIQLANGNNIITFSNPINVGKYSIALLQPASGAKATVTWPTIRWVNNTPPTLTETNSKLDLISLQYWDSLGYIGNYSTNY